MARVMWEGDTKVYRAVIEHHFAAVPATADREAQPERTTTGYAGPFVSKAAATAAIKRAQRDNAERSTWYVNYYGEATVTGHVEESPLDWWPVG